MSLTQNNANIRDSDYNNESNYSHRRYWGRIAFVFSFIMNFFLALIKIFVGLAIGSIAMIADAIDNSLDLITSILVFIGLFWSSKPADDDHQYGHEKGEVFSVLLISMLLIFSGIFIIIESFNRYLRNDFPIFSFIGIFASILSIGGKYILFRVLLKISKKISSPGVKADAYNYRIDIITSFGVLIAISFSYFNFYIIDPIVAIIISFLIFKTAWNILRESVMVILDEAPSGLEERVFNLVNSVPSVLDIHNIRIRHLGSKIIADCHVRVNSNLSIEKAHKIMNEVEQTVYKNTDISEILIHVEPENEPC